MSFYGDGIVELKWVSMEKGKWVEMSFYVYWKSEFELKWVSMELGSVSWNKCSWKWGKWVKMSFYEYEISKLK
jgi:hypothetical protein